MSSSALRKPPDSAPPQFWRIGKYQILKQIGSGGMANVYLSRIAKGPGSGRLVVIKVSRPPEPNQKVYAELFHSEIQFMLGLRHPNIVTLYDVGEYQGQPYLVLEWVDGPSLKKIIQHSRQYKSFVPTNIVLWLIQEACRGLHYAHGYVDQVTGESRPIIHRDISPSNLLIDLNGNVKIIDFGIAKTLSRSITNGSRAIVGNPGHMSPEQWKGEHLSPRTDIFSLGVIFWELLTGQVLFPGDSIGAIRSKIAGDTPIPPPSSVKEGVSTKINEIVLKALSRDPKERFPTAEAFGNEIRQYLDDRRIRLSSNDVSSFIHEVFGYELKSEREEVKTLVDEAHLIEAQPKVPDSDAGQFTRSISVNTGLRQIEIPKEDEAVVLDFSAQKTFVLPKIRSSSSLTPKEKRLYHIRLILDLFIIAFLFYIYLTSGSK